MASERQSGDTVLGNWLRAETALDPHRRFVQCASDWATLAEFDRRSDRVAAALQGLGVGKGDRVAVNLPNCMEFIVLIYAIAKVGAIQVPLNTYLRGEFLRHQLVQTEPIFYITDDAGQKMLAPVLPQLASTPRLILVGQAHGSEVRYEQLENCTRELIDVELTPSDVCGIIYTSGTTGPSKGCTITHGYYCNLVNVFVDFGWYEHGDVIFGANPLFHFSGQTWLVAAALAVSGSAIVEPAFSASRYMTRIRQTGATTALGMGAMGMAVLAQPVLEGERDHKLRHITFMPSSAELITRFEERFGIAPFAEVFGQSECWPALLGDPRGPRRPGSMGKVTPGLQVKLVNDDDSEVPAGQPGEIVVRPTEPHRLFSNYWNDPEATVAAFRNLWHHTGDMGRRDDEGYFWFVDRKKDSIRRRGENVSSIELEQAILRHDAVANVAVHAVPSELGEDDIKVCIVLAPQAHLTPEMLFGFFKSRLPYYAIPRYVEFVDELPANVNGRVQKFLLRERAITSSTVDFDKLNLVVSRAERRAT
jgi:crotonobetaine/carnitine-CoA ligase